MVDVQDRANINTWHQDFAGALVPGGGDLPEHLFDGAPDRVAAGWRIYQNNVAHSLTEVLRDTFPVVNALVGQDFFSFAAATYMRRQMPATAIASDYGAGFSAFLTDLPEAKSIAYIGDVAELEYSRLRSWHAPRQSAVTPQDLASIPPERFSGALFDLKASLQVIVSRHPVVTIWLEHQKDVPDFSLVDLDGAECGMTWRQDGQIYTRAVTPPLARFILALQRGATLAQAAERAEAAEQAQQSVTVAGETGFSLEEALALLITSALITDVSEKEKANDNDER